MNKLYCFFKLFNKKNCCANYHYKTFQDIPFSLLKERGIKYIISDIDQTIVSQSNNLLSDSMQKKLKEIQSLFGKNSFCLLTNEPSTQRTDYFNLFDIDVINSQKDKKPCINAFLNASHYFGENITPDAICFIGDRVFTDIIGANNARMLTIQVDVVDIQSDSFITSLLRKIEKIYAKGCSYSTQN